MKSAPKGFILKNRLQEYFYLFAYGVNDFIIPLTQVECWFNLIPDLTYNMCALEESSLVCCVPC